MEWIKSWFKSLFDPLWDAFQRLFDFLNDFWLALRYFLDSLAGAFVEEVLFFFQEFIDNLPVPDFVSDAADAMQGIPPDVMYFAGAFRIAEGLTMIMAAYILRFIIRRIPIIG